MITHLLHFTVNPNKIFFTIPGINRPVAWYGVLFALAFFLGYFLVRKFFQNYLYDKTDIVRKSTKLTDRLAVYLMIATVLGARLAEVFFYDWPYYKQHPLAIFKVWEGGLASHGAAVFILLALVLFVIKQKKIYPELTFLALLDILVIPVSLAAALIRFGNFINQEVVGIPTDLPWGIKFAHPMHGPANVALHPVQLYESIFYLFIFLVLISVLKKRKNTFSKGLLSGIFLTSIFSFRFFIEQLKLPLSQLISENSFLKMGQYLSLPFIGIGIYLLIRFIRNAKKRASGIIE